MSPADILVAAVIIVSGFFAFRLGLVHVILWLAGWVGATVVTIYGFPHVSPFARQWMGDGVAADILAGAALFLVSLVVLTYVKHALAGRVRRSAVGPLDRTLGLAVGLVLGIAVVSGAYVAGRHFGLSDNWEFYRDARSLPLVRQAAGLMVALMPPDWAEMPSSAPVPDAEQQFRTLLSPQTKTEPPKTEPGYNAEERREMDRLFNTQR